MSEPQSAATPGQDAAPERMHFELDEGTTDMVSRLARMMGVAAEDVIAKAIANEAFIVTELRHGRRFELRDRDRVAPVRFA